MNQDTRVISFSYAPYRLNFLHPFETAHGRREGTDAVFVRMDCGTRVGFGEATLPPYLMYTQQNVLTYFQKHVPEGFHMPDNPEIFLGALPADCPPALAAIDMALWQLMAATSGKPVHELLSMGPKPNRSVPHTFTIGMGAKETMHARVEEGLAAGFTNFKLKLDGSQDREVVEQFCRVTAFPFAVDVNQGWKDVGYAKEFVKWLEQKGCFLVEQPFPVNHNEWMESLTIGTTIPIIADESCQREADIEKLAGKVDGINIKLQKCGGLEVAAKMIRRARELNMKVLIGCMSESSVGCGAAEGLAPWCDWADLDGPWLISNNPVPDTLFA